MSENLKAAYASLERNHKAFKHRSHMAALKRTYAQLEREHDAFKDRLNKKNVSSTPMLKRITRSIRPYHPLESDGLDVKEMARQFVRRANVLNKNVKQGRKTKDVARRELDASFAALIRAYGAFQAMYTKYERRLKSNQLSALSTLRRGLSQKMSNARARHARKY